MDIFLNFKNKSYEAQFYESIDPYLSKVVKACLISVIVVLPFFPYTQYEVFRNATSDVPRFVRAVVSPSIYALLALSVVFIYKKREFLRRHQKATRMGFDIFFTLVAGWYAYSFFDLNNNDANNRVNYITGWWHCLLAVVLFSPISRWYLKLAAFLSVILRIGIGSYLESQSTVGLLQMVRMIMLEVLLTYYHEKDRRKYFIEKQALYEETKVFKDIFDLTSDGVILYGLKEGMIFRNWSNDKYRWWQGDECRPNFERILLKGYKKMAQLPSNMDLDLSTHFQSSNQTNLSDLFDHLTQQINVNMVASQHSLSGSVHTASSTQNFKPGNLMLLTGSVEQEQQQKSSDPSNPTTNSNYLLEIKVMFTVFREKPSLALVFSDITERNLVTVLQETNNYKSRLLASVSHELRTPLNASINFTQAALEHPDLAKLSEIKEEYLMPSLRSSQLLLHLINDILDFSQMSENKLRLVFENKNLHDTLDECVNLIKIQAAKKGIGLRTDYKFENERNEMFCTDHNRLKQIVLNLLSNALKFTLEGEIQITASIDCITKLPSSSSSEIILMNKSPSEDRKRMKKYRILRVSVRDTGIGISPENKSKLFRTFEKIELGDRITLNSQGVGLGLVISNNLVLMLGPPSQNNGMEVESEENIGSTFSFWIVDQNDLKEEVQFESFVKSEDLCSQMNENPMLDDPGHRLDTISNLLPQKGIDSVMHIRKKLTTGTETLISSDPTLTTIKTPQILVVDDDVFNISALTMVLHKLGYSCDTAFNGKQAIQKIMGRQLNDHSRSNPTKQYKLVFMDCNMPIMDGFEATKILKGKMRNGEIEGIPIVACTALLNEKEKQLAYELGIDAYVLKPLEKDKIEVLLKKFVGSSV